MKSKRIKKYPKLNTISHKGPLPNPIKALEDIFHKGKITLIEAAFQNSFFLDPEQVRGITPKFPGFARYSRTHYPNKKKGDIAKWDGRKIKLDDNSKAQSAWAQYSGCALSRQSGYGVRHIWGNPWNPDAYTAGWNLCYMPFWVGMLTENQHPHLNLQKAIKQAAYELFFRDNPVGKRPGFVTDPGFAQELRKHLGKQPIQILRREERRNTQNNNVIKAGHKSVLPIRLVPQEPDFKKAILRTHQAAICVSYKNRHKENKMWKVSGITAKSNMLGNLRARSQFDKAIGKKKG